MSATQNIYSTIWKANRGNETNALYSLDVNCYPGCANGKTLQYWPGQYSSLFASASVGSSNYHAAQLMLRHPKKNGVTFDVNYTLSKSMDLGSDTEVNQSAYAVIRDAWNPRKNYGVSEFDTRHLLTADWIIDIPTGKNQRFFAGGNNLINMLIGGWSVTGIARVSSGLPFSVRDDGWTTNWEFSSTMVQTAPIKMRKHINAVGAPTVFDNATAARAALRYPYPGEAEQRNRFRGDGYFDIDSGVHKTITFFGHYKFDIAVEAYNITNSVRFDPHSIDMYADDSQFGTYGSSLSTPRLLQFSGRFSF